MENALLLNIAGLYPPAFTHLAIDPSGRRVACGTADGKILLIDSQNGKTQRTLTGHEKLISAVAFGRDEKSLISTSWDSTTRLWDCSSKSQNRSQAVLSHHTHVKALSVDPISMKGASGARDGEVKVFSLKTLKCLRNLQAHDTDISGVSFIDDGSKLLTSSWDGSCKLWDLSSYENLGDFSFTGQRIRSMSVSPDPTRVLLGMQTGMISCFDLENPKRRTELKGHLDVVSSMAVDPTGKTMVSTGLDQRIVVWSLEDTKQLCEARLATGISCVKWGVDPSSFYTTDFSGSVLLWKVHI